MIPIYLRLIVLSAVLLCASTCLAVPAHKAADKQLFAAAHQGDLTGVRSALAHGADVNAHDEEGDTPLIVQIQTQWFNVGDVPTVRALLRAGAQVDARGKGGRTALMLAAKLGWTESMRLLLLSGAQVEARDSEGQTPLMQAAYGSVVQESSTDCSSPEAVRLLLARGARANARDKMGQTALMWAARTAIDDLMPGGAGEYHQLAFESARLLLNHGANPDLASRNGNTALKWARLRRHKALVKLLSAYAKRRPN